MMLDYGPFIVTTAGVIMLVYWICFAIFLPMREKYIKWVSSKNWIWVNTLGFSAAIWGIIASFVIVRYIGDNALNLVSFLIVVIGSVIMSSLLYFEAFVLPGLISSAPHLVDQTSTFYNSKAFVRIRVIGGLIFSVGFICWGLVWLVDGMLPVWSSIMMMIGAPLFSLVFLPGNLRLVGVLLYSTALVGIGLSL